MWTPWPRRTPKSLEEHHGELWDGDTRTQLRGRTVNVTAKVRARHGLPPRDDEASPSAGEELQIGRADIGRPRRPRQDQTR